jgi:PTS system nitrogen regulatory IIA component
MKLADTTSPDLICTDLESESKNGVLIELGNQLARVCPQLSGDEIADVLIERERLATTGVGEGVAFPHGKIDRLERLWAAIGISQTGIQFDAIDNAPVHIFFALLAPLNSSGEHLKALARASRLMKNPDFRARLIAAQNPEAAFEVICTEDEKQ